MDISEYLRQERGRAGQLALRLGVSASLVIQWANGKQVALERCAKVEEGTQGGVTCEELRPDLVWQRTADADWPWHPQGRPLIDVTRQPAANTQETRDAA